ncbi:hypothetical protein ACHQM5_021840 [Ranunculus cassubicifolius]
MADALVSMVAEQFLCYVQKEVDLVVGVREEVGKLKLTLEMIQGVLQDAEQNQVKNSVVRVWLGELRDVLYDADDVMDKWNTELTVSRLQSGEQEVVVSPHAARKVLSYLLSPCSCLNHATVRYDIGHRIKEIGERLDGINAKRSQFGLIDSPSEDQPRLMTSSIIDVSKIHGRDQDTRVMVSRLLGESSRQDMGVQVIAIVGMAGFGKTTLAKLVLEEEEVVKAFKKKMWVCVSEPFDLFGVAKAIIEEAGKDVPSSNRWEVIHHWLSKSVKGERFLLVLDDVWTNDPKHWDPLKVSLDGGSSGSRVIVTTRNEEVAKMMGSSHIHNLEKLSEVDSWSLLRDIALKGRDGECKKFEKIGKEIASKCNGVPLALSTLARLLCVKRTVQNWRDILASEIWDLAHIKDFFLPSLFMSYYALHPVSKQCFLYCAVFPKDTELEKDVLVKLWMAEGFLGSARKGELENVGEDHFENLAMASFFQDFKKDSNGNITSCKMHGLVHDFAQYLSQGECSNNATFDCQRVRYLYSEEINNSSIYEAKKVRTILCQRRMSVEVFIKLPCLRVLDMHDSDLDELSETVDKLVHLRYLDLSGTKLLELPETICNLYNLQTLRLNRCRRLHKLPEEIGRLSNLRHLEMVETVALDCLPQSIKRLSSLRTLSKFIVNQDCKIGDLKFLKNIRGALQLKGLGRMTDVNDVTHADLKMRKDLRCLTLECENVEESDAAIEMENMFERLEPHEDLEELAISYYGGSQFPRWFHNSSNIVKIKLYKCDRCIQLPALGKLESLESLTIHGMGVVKSIGREFCGFGSTSSVEMIAFPKLKTLELKEMMELENWELPISKDIKIMPLLRELSLHTCPKLIALPCLGNLESLEKLCIWGLSSYERLDLGISDDGDDSDDHSVQQQDIIFPNLKELTIRGMNKLEQWSLSFGKYGVHMMPSLQDLTIMFCTRLRVLPDLRMLRSLISLDLSHLSNWEGQTEEEEIVTNEKERGAEDHSMPSSFRELIIQGCFKLNDVPSYLFSPTLKKLSICDCAQLSGLQCLPPLLESLWLTSYNGGYSKSFPLANECFISYVGLHGHRYSSLPEGFKNLKALRKLELQSNKFLDFELKELEHFTMLQELEIFDCCELEKCFEGDEWRSILAHVPKITINGMEITNREDHKR